MFNQSLKPLEVMVVDGRSTDDTLKIARQFPVEVVIEEEPTSLPNARNMGIEAAKGDVLFIMDSDVILEKDCIENALKYFDDPNILAVIPSEYNIAHTRLEKIQIEWLRGTANPVRMGIGISVFAEFLRKIIFKQIKFDPSLGYGEDEDFQQRLKRLNKTAGKIIHAYDSKISLHHPHTFKELWSQYTWYGRTFKRYLLKDHSIKPILCLISNIAPMFLLILGALTIFFILVLPFLVIFSALLIARNLIACYRSKSTYFAEFIGFEFTRSLFFIVGITQGIFSKKRGK